MPSLGIPALTVLDDSLGAPVLPAGPPTVARGARLLDRTGNPVIDPVTGGFVKADAVMMRVYLAVKTTLASASGDKTVGSKLPRKVGNRFEAELRTSVQLALAGMIAERTITLENVTAVQIHPGTYAPEIEYTNLLTNSRDRIQV